MIFRAIFLVGLGGSLILGQAFSIGWAQVPPDVQETSEEELPGMKIPQPWQLIRREDIAKVWSGHPVGFAFLQKKGQIFVGFYASEDRSMVIAQKKSPEAAWTFKTLPTRVGWDSHNSIAMAFDSDDILHVSGNMHGAPLVYFRAEKPLDIETLQPIHRMVATGTTPKELREAHEYGVTYPRFYWTSDGQMLFNYRNGSASNGALYWNQYDPSTRTWHRFLDTPLFDGEGNYNAYSTSPKRDTQGIYHVAWVWRDDGRAETNHDLSYMRSRDLKHWEKSDGTPLELPVTLAKGEILDPRQPGEGLLNSRVRVSFDTQNRVIVSYMAYDEHGNNQIYHLRQEQSGWKKYQTTDWKNRWEFQGYGCLPTLLTFSEIEIEDGKMILTWSHWKEKSGRFVLDENTLKPIGPAPPLPKFPKACTQTENPQENQKQKRFSLSDEHDPNRMYLFVWETLPVHQDRPRDILPVPSTLRMFVLERPVSEK